MASRDPKELSDKGLRKCPTRLKVKQCPDRGWASINNVVSMKKKKIKKGHSKGQAIKRDCPV